MKKMNEEKLDQMARYIKDYIERYGDSPKFGKIIEHMGMSNSVGYRYLMTLRDRGVIVYSGKDTLSIEGQEKMRPAYRRVPILGGIPCGSPEEHTELVEGYVALPEEWLFGDCYLLRAEGDSMTGAGIDDGYRIAESCGFDTLEIFYRRFRRHFGMTPGEFRVKKANSELPQQF